jgi:mono/diheme cytochrome c family protein
MKKTIFTLAILILFGLSTTSIASDGKTTFMMKCSGCHGSTAQGSAMAPPLAGSDLINGDDSVVKGIILKGATGEAKRYEKFPLSMPKYTMNDSELGALIDFLKSL